MKKQYREACAIVDLGADGKVYFTLVRVRGGWGIELSGDALAQARGVDTSPYDVVWPTRERALAALHEGLKRAEEEAAQAKHRAGL